VANYFSDHRIGVKCASNRAELHQHLRSSRPRLILMDVKLGRENGLDLLRELRSQSDVPIIIVSGYCRNEADRVTGLELGADDYLVKPFGLRELLARVQAILRRQTEKPAEKDRKVARGYRFQGWTLECRSQKLFNPEGATVPLTRREYELLVAFLKAAGRCVTRNFLIQATTVHGGVSHHSVNYLIKHLRQKIESDPSAPKMIQTKRRIGYVFALPVDPL
jgi:two-component system, OmpR family, response regulator